MEKKQGKKSVLSKQTKNLGEQLIDKFSLNKFKIVLIQKVINSTANIYVITVDSRNKTQSIPYKKVKSSLTSSFKRVQKTKPMVVSFSPFILQNTVYTEDVKLTPPTDLRSFHGPLMRGSIFIFRDLIGENFVDKKNYA
jgi:hypothetical protein